MFRWLNKQGVESDKGYSVQFTGRFTCEYREKGIILELEIEDGYLGSKPSIHMRRDDIKAWSKKGISVQKQQEIIENLKAAMEFQGLKFILD